MEQKNIIIIVVVAIVAVIIGGVLGASMQTSKNAPQGALTQKIETAIKSLSSEKVVPSIIAYGQVAKIDGRNVTLTNGGQTITVPVSEKANVLQFVAPVAGSKTAAPTQKKIAFSEVKKGDSLNITLKVAVDGGIEGQSVVIIMKGK